jgi:predicted PurR-regulated permease PerM
MQKAFSKIPSEIRVALFFPAVFLNGWLLIILLQQMQPLVSIVIVAALFAFLLEYPVRFLRNLGLRQVFAVGIVLIVAVVILTIIALTLVPVILQQANEFITNLPTFIKILNRELASLDAWAEARQLPISLDGITAQFTGQLAGQAQKLASQALNVAFETIGGITNIVLVLVFTVVLTFSGEQVFNGLLSWLPEWWKQQVQMSLRKTFESFITGQFIVASIGTVLQTTAFLVMQVPFGLLFGVGIGVMSLIPLGGATTITVLGIILILQNFWLGIKVLIVTVILGQINETLIAPRVLSDLVGLNLFWVLISLLLGARFGGPLGLFLAVPLASFIKILADRIKASKIDTQKLLMSEDT